MTLSCAITYIRYGDDRRVEPGAGFSASISWDSAAGTLLSSTSTTPNNTVVETLTVDVVTLASGTEIPSYNCTAEFSFTDTSNTSFHYAVNDLSWTCVSAPVNTWCMYFKLLC